MYTLVTTRFNNITWESNKKYRTKYKLPGCIYGSPQEMSPKILDNSLVFVVEMNNEETYQFGFVIVDDKIADFVEEGHEQPNYSIIITENTLLWIANSDDSQQAISDAYTDGYIIVKAHTFVSKVKLGVFGKLYKWFG